MDTYLLLAKEIVLKAIKDYRTGDEETRRTIRAWADDEDGSLSLCAVAFGRDAEQVRKYLTKRLDELDRHTP